MYLIKMAVRNVLRQKFRTTLSALVVVSGVWVLILGQGFIGGLRENVIKASVDTMSGHISLRPLDYPDSVLESPIENLYEVTPNMAQAFDDVSESWTARTYAKADAIAYPNSLRVQLIGYDPVRDPTVFPRRDWKVVGAIPDKGALLISKGVAKLFELEVGDVLTLSLRTVEGSWNAATLPIDGIYSIGNPLLDGAGVMVPNELFASLVNSPNVSHVSMRLSHRDEASAAQVTLTSQFGKQLEAVTWIDETKELLEIQDIRQQSLNFLVFILLGIAGLGIANTILMAAFERMREIGTLRAMGMRRRRVVVMFLIEGGLIGFGGGLLGAVIGASMIYYWSVNPIDLSSMLEDKGAGNFPISVYLYTEFSWGLTIGSFVFGIVISVLSSIYPSFVATRVAPADAVRAV